MEGGNLLGGWVDGEHAIVFGWETEFIGLEGGVGVKWRDWEKKRLAG